MSKVLLEDGTEIHFASRSGAAFEALAADEGGPAIQLKNVVEASTSLIRESIEVIIEGLGRISPDELEIEVGLSVSKEGSIIISKGKAEGNISVRATWKSKSLERSDGTKK